MTQTATSTLFIIAPFRSSSPGSRRPTLLRLWTLIAWIWLATGIAHAGGGSDYITLDEFTRINPEQTALMREFAAQVEADNPPQLKAHTKPVRIAAVYPGKQQSDYWRRTMQALKLRLERRGLTYQLDQHTFSLNASIERQQQAINEALKEDPDYLILTLDDPRQQRMIEQLLARARPKIILLNITTPVKDWASHQPLLYSGFDHILGTQLLAKTLFQLPQNRPQGRPHSIGLLYRKPGYVSTMRGGTFADIVHARGETLSASYYTQSDAASSRLAALRLIDQDPNLSIIFASGTDVALGAIQAINEKGLSNKILVNGWGGGQNELEAILNKEMALTVMRMNDDSAIAIADAISNDQRGQPVPRIYSGRFVVVTQQHSAEQIRFFSDTAFRYSNP